ncbi:hypothetical protein RUM44_011562, partial [Polyplax serrata]
NFPHCRADFPIRMPQKKDGSEVLGRFKTNRRQTDDEKERKVESPRAHVKDNEFSAHDVDAPMMKYIGFYLVGR